MNDLPNQMEHIKIKAWGLFRLTKQQFLILELVVLLFFITLTIFLFTFEFPVYSEDPVLNFHAKYSKYFSLVCCFLVIIEAQFFLSKFIKAQLTLIRKQNHEIEQQKEEIVLQNQQLEIQKKEIERQRDEIEGQRDLATIQRDKIHEQKEAITDSIQYASRIQSALLPPKHYICENLSDFFILYKPRDIVSGDFYWLYSHENYVFIVVADCTGHGVPGALMSMLGISLLNEVTNANIQNNPDDIKANIILNQLRDAVIKSLHQTGDPKEMKDGMDISLCVYNKQKGELQYAGANNPLIVVKKADKTDYKQYSGMQLKMRSEKDENLQSVELFKIKPDRMPIGIYVKEETPFSNHVIQIQQGDLIYLLTDGYIDQFGGEDNRKFMMKKLYRLLTDIQAKPMAEQQKILDETITGWKGELEQVDDILIMGIRF
jgi:serine phosphatase RsbU (regulator of sigma subunit)